MGGQGSAMMTADVVEEVEDVKVHVEELKHLWVAAEKLGLGEEGVGMALGRLV